MGYCEEQLEELGKTIRDAECDVVVLGTPMELARLVDLGHQVRRTSYEFDEAGTPTLESVVRERLRAWLPEGTGVGS